MLWGLDDLNLFGSENMDWEVSWSLCVETHKKKKKKKSVMGSFLTLLPMVYRESTAA